MKLIAKFNKEIKMAERQQTWGLTPGKAYRPIGEETIVGRNKYIYVKNDKKQYVSVNMLRFNRVS